MKKIVFLIYFISSTIIAGRLESLDDSAHFIEAIPSQVGSGILIRSCSESGCRIYPHENASLYNFYGLDSEWEEVFSNCSNFEHLNNLYLITMTFAASSPAARAVKGLKFVSKTILLI